MTHDGTEPTHVSQVPLGWEPIADCGSDLPEAQRFYADQRNRDDEIMLVIDDRGDLTVWKCKQPLWPYY